MKAKYLLFTLLILAETLFANSNSIFFVDCRNDLSAKFLTHIFGNNLMNHICAADSSESMLGAVFRVFNLGLVVFAGGFISYAAVSTALSRSQDGGQASGGSNPWLPVRLVTGASLLVPLKSGYSFIQIIVMWAVIHGVGLSNSIWNKQLEELKKIDIITNNKNISDSSIDLLANNGVSDLEKLKLTPDKSYNVPAIYATGVCLAVLQKQNTAARELDNNVPIVQYGVSNDCGQEYKEYGKRVFCAGSLTDSRQKTACGVFLFGEKIAANKKVYLDDLSNKIKLQIRDAKIQAINMLNNPNIYNADTENCAQSGSTCRELSKITGELSPVIDRLITIDKTSPKIDYVNFNTSNIIATVDPNPDYEPAVIDGKNDQGWIESSKKIGWISAGQHYYKFSNQSTTAKSDLDKSKITSYLPKIIKGMTVEDNKSGDLANDYVDSLLSVGDSGAFKKLSKNLYDTVTQEAVQKAINKAKQTERENYSVNNSESEVYQGAIELKNKLVEAMITKPKNLDLSESAISMTSNITDESARSIFVSAPLDNMMVLLGLVAGDLTGLSIRQNRWVTDQETGYKFYEDVDNTRYGYCRHGDDFDKICIKENVGIVGYLLSYYDLGSENGDTVEGVSKTIDPLTNISNIGRAMLRHSVDYWVNTLQAIYDITKSLSWRYSAIKASLSALGGILSGFGVLGSILGAVANAGAGIFEILYKLDLFNLGIFLPLGAVISGVFFMLGVTLGIYAPIIPFMIFTFTVIGWAIAVIEAMIAAPLVALGVTHPQGHDLLGKAEQSTILLLGIFIRPAAIILGFIAAIYLLKEVLMLVNTGFLMLITQLFKDSLNTLNNANQLIAINILVLGILMVYVYIILAAVNQTFSLIYQVPEKLLRWIGAAPENSGVAQMAGEVKQGSQATGQALSQGGQQTVGNKPQVDTVNADEVGDSITKAMRDRNKKSSDSTGREG